MARIRTIKPEFPQSESVGRLTRDARLLFIELWPICDDHGRTRAASRMLASTLFPYDDDARDLIDSWLDELEQVGCIRRYEVDGLQYLEICNWLNHQKIDKPSKPQFPEPSESPRGSSRALGEPSGLEGKGKEGKGGEGSESSPRGKSKKAEQTLPEWVMSLPDAEEIISESDPIYDWALKVGIPRTWIGVAWFAFEGKYGENPKKYADWRAVFRTAVRADWLKLWRQDTQGRGWALTTAGQMAEREMSA